MGEDTCSTLQKADAALERGDLVQAGTHYMTVARQAPDNGEAWLGVSRVLLLSGKFDRATQIVDSIIAPQHRSKAWLGLAGVLVSTRDLGRAAELIKRSMALQPNNPEAYALQAVIFRHTNNTEAELQALERALQASPEDPQSWDALVTAMARTSGPDAAIDFLERERDVVPKAVEIDLRRAQLSVSAGRMGEAESQIQAILRTSPDHPEAHMVQALFFLNTDKPEEAIPALERAIRRSSDDSQLWEALIKVLQQVRGPEATIDYLESRHDAVPKDLTIDVHRAQLCFSAGRRQEAEARMREILIANPGNTAVTRIFTDLLLDQARSALSRGDHVEASRHYMAVTTETPENAEAWLGASRASLMAADFDGATALVARAIALEPRNAEAHVVKASILQSTGDHEGEANALKEATRYSPTDAQAWKALISVLERVSGAEAVIDYLESHRDAVPKGVTMDLRKAQLCLAAGQLRKFGLVVKRILSQVEKSPDDVTEHIAVARGLAELGREHISLELLRGLTRRLRNTVGPFIALADLLRGENSTVNEAITNLEHALTLQPENASLLRNLAECHARQARYSEAADLFITAMERSTKAEVHDCFRLGIILRHAGRISEAEAYMRRALAMASEEMSYEPRHVRNRAAKSALVARILMSLGRGEQALEYYRNMVQDWDGGALSYDPALYLPDTPGRLDHLRHIVRGRDTMILCHGPSISALTDWGDRLGALDVCVAAVNRFKVFEKGFLARSGRTVDIVLETHYKSVRQLVDQILEFLERPANNMFIANRWVMDRLGTTCPSRSEFEQRFDQKLLYFGGQGGTQPATPHNPLRYVQGNSLSALVNLMVIAGAKRIFLFGADGGIPRGDAGTTHYGAETEDFRLDITDGLRQAFSASLYADALEFGEIVNTGLLSVQGLFGIKPPPIFNVSPSSRIDAFPRITYETAWSMFSGH